MHVNDTNAMTQIKLPGNQKKCIRPLVWGLGFGSKLIQNIFKTTPAIMDSITLAGGATEDTVDGIN